MKAKTHRNKLGEDNDKSSSKCIPGIAGFFIYTSEQPNVRQGLWKWRYVWNKKVHHITANECNGPIKKRQEWNAGSDLTWMQVHASNKKCNACLGNITKWVQWMTTIKPRTREGGINVLFKDHSIMHSPKYNKIVYEIPQMGISQLILYRISDHWLTSVGH